MITNELLRHAAAGPNSTAPGPEVVILVFSGKLGQLSGYLDQRTQGRMEADWLHLQWTGEFAIVQDTIYKSQREKGVRKWSDAIARLRQCWKNGNAGRIGVSRRKVDFRPGGHCWPGGGDEVSGGVAGVVNYVNKTVVPAPRHQGRGDWRAMGPGKGGREAGEAGDGWCAHSVMELDQRLMSCVSGFGGLGAATADVVERHLGG